MNANVAIEYFSFSTADVQALESKANSLLGHDLAAADAIAAELWEMGFPAKAKRIRDIIKALKADTEATKPLTREQLRSKRRRAVRARTISIKRMTKRELELGRMLFPSTDHERPKTRAECQNGLRPCPYVSCHHHLYLDINEKTGAIKVNFPDLEPEDLTESCALDVADRGGATLEEVGVIMNVTRECIRKLEVNAMAQIMASEEVENLKDFAEEGPVGKRRLPLVNSRTSGEDTADEDEADEDEDELEEDGCYDYGDEPDCLDEEECHVEECAEVALWKSHETNMVIG